MRSGCLPDRKQVRKRRKLKEYREKRHFPESATPTSKIPGQVLMKEEDLWKEYDNTFQIQGTYLYTMSET